MPLGLRRRLPAPDGSCIRDYIDVVDLAKAHVAAINRMAGDKNKQAYEIFNVGTGRGGLGCWNWCTSSRRSTT